MYTLESPTPPPSLGAPPHEQWVTSARRDRAASEPTRAEPVVGPPRHSPRYLDRPKDSVLRPSHAAWFVGLNLIVITAMWIAHGGVPRDLSLASAATAAGQLAALYGTFALLVQAALVARVPWVEHRLGTDRLLRWHRLAGFGLFALLSGHVGLTTIGWGAANGRNPVAEVWNMIETVPNALAATVGFAVIVAIVVTSMRWARRALAYETWYFIHLYAYLAVALSFAHQFSVGADFADDLIARIYWIALHLAVILLIIGHRFAAPIINFARFRTRIASVVHESDNTYSLWITGRGLHRFKADAGQFINLRVLNRQGWWTPHPFSLSSKPTDAGLRITIKVQGDGTAMLRDIRPGTKVVVEGPYGAFRSARSGDRPVLLIAGGIGIAPIRALFEDLVRPAGQVTLLYRVSRPEDMLFQSELEAIARAKGHRIVYVVGPRRWFGGERDPFRPTNLATIAPDLDKRDVYICGSSSLMATASRAVRDGGVPRSRVYTEDFGI